MHSPSPLLRPLSSISSPLSNLVLSLRCTTSIEHHGVLYCNAMQCNVTYLNVLCRALFKILVKFRIACACSMSAAVLSCSPSLVCAWAARDNSAE